MSNPPSLTPQGTSVWVTGTAGSTQPVFPTGYTPTAGHLALLYTAVTDGGASMPTPSGWVLTPNQPSLLVHIFAKFLVGGDTLPILAWAGGTKTASTCVVLAGDLPTDITSIFETANFRQSNTTSGFPFPSLAISGANDFLVAFGMRHKTATGNNETVSKYGSFALGPTVVPAGDHICAAVDFWQQTAATAVAIGTQSTSIADTTNSSVGYIIAVKTQGAPSAGFTAGPAINSTTAIPNGAYTIGFTGSAAGTFHAVALLAGAPAPSAAQVVAGTDASGAAALAAVSKAVTGADSAVLGGSLTLPLYDVYCVFTTTVNSAVVAFPSQFLKPTTGKQFTVVSGPPGAGIDSIGTGAVPPFAANDVIEADLTTTPGAYALFISSVGAPEYVGATSRQSFTARVYDYSAGTWSLPVTDYVNNSPPTFQNNLGPYSSALNTLITPIDLTAGFVDPQGDSVTVTAVSGLPPGIFVSGNKLTGTGTVAGIYTVTVQGADPAGDASTGTFLYIVGDVPIPTDLRGENQDSANAELTAAFFAPQFVLVPDAGPAGVVLATTPPSTAESPGFAPPFSAVIVSISTPIPNNGGGNTGGGGTGTGGSGTGGTTTPPPPIQSPGAIVARLSSVDLKISDVNQFWGNDLSLSNTQDIDLVSGTILSQQKVLRRLLTNPGDYLFQPNYGAGLLAYVGQTTDVAKITALITSQILLEDAVAKSPAPVITVTNAASDSDASAVSISIAYTDANSGEPQVLSFSLSK